MDLGTLFLTVIVVGILWWAVTTYVPMPPAGKTVLTIAVVVVMIVCLFSFLGLGGGVLHWRPNLH
jgi:hypothetical protein